MRLKPDHFPFVSVWNLKLFLISTFSLKEIWSCFQICWDHFSAKVHSDPKNAISLLLSSLPGRSTSPKENYQGCPLHWALRCFLIIFDFLPFSEVPTRLLREYFKLIHLPCFPQHYRSCDELLFRCSWRPFCAKSEDLSKKQSCSIPFKHYQFNEFFLPSP